MKLVLQRRCGNVCPIVNFSEKQRFLNIRPTSILKQIATVCFVGIAFMFCYDVNAQSSPADCKLGCTSNDVQVKAAYLSDASGNKLSTSFVCPQSGSAAVYLTLELTTKTPRVGVVIFANIKDFTGGTPGATIATPSQ